MRIPQEAVTAAARKIGELFRYPDTEVPPEVDEYLARRVLEAAVPYIFTGDDPGARALGDVVARYGRAMEAARIEMIQNGPEKAMQWILNALPDVWDGELWDGQESAHEWYARDEWPDRQPVTGRLRTYPADLEV